MRKVIRKALLFRNTTIAQWQRIEACMMLSNKCSSAVLLPIPILITGSTFKEGIN